MLLIYKVHTICFCENCMQIAFSPKCRGMFVSLSNLYNFSELKQCRQYVQINPTNSELWNWILSSELKTLTFKLYIKVKCLAFTTHTHTHTHTRRVQQHFSTAKKQLSFKVHTVKKINSPKRVRSQSIACWDITAMCLCSELQPTDIPSLFLSYSLFISSLLSSNQKYFSLLK